MDSGGGAEYKRLADDIAATLQRALSDSPQIVRALNRAKELGYDVSLVLEATIGLSRTSGAPATTGGYDFRLEKSEPVPLKMTPLDKKFLRSLRITIEEDE